MPWMKIDDSFESHPKVKSIPKGKRTKAIGLWTLAGSWCARHLTDGFVPVYMVGELGGTKAESSLLVSASLWHEVDGGFTFHDWTDHQPSRAKVEEERDAAKERMRVARERKKGTSSGNVRANTSERTRTRAENFGNGSSVTPTRPDPTRPDPEENTPLSDKSDNAPATPDRFDEFWDAYAYKLKRADAEKSWLKAIRKADPDRIISAAASYAAHIQADKAARGDRAPDQAHATTWLNAERWNDERPLRQPQQHQGRASQWLQLAADMADENPPTNVREIGPRR